MRVRTPFSLRILLGCALLPLAAAAEETRLTVSARQPWTDTSVDVSEGQRFRVEATGRARVLGLTAREYLFGFDFERRVGPEGTYRWPGDYPARRRPPRPMRSAGRGRAPEARLPLPAMEDGPAPAFCLVGRIGTDGEPFYVGRRYEGAAAQSGRLWLGLNDDEFRDNRGAFEVRIVLDAVPPAAPPLPPLIEPAGTGRPVPNARVLLLYVDGLRPDVVHEMAALGFLPNLQQAFLDGGLECLRGFTVFPSNTLVANGSLFTGLFPDRTGIKSQNQFERTMLKPRGPLSEWLPDWLFARTASPTTVHDLLDKFAPENTHRFLRERKIPTMAERVGKGYRFTILPIMPVNPPPQWPHRAVNVVDNPFAASVQIPSQLDMVNTRYLMEEVIGDQDARVIVAWFPMIDKVSHHHARGQFGAARRELAFFDRWLGKIMRRLRQVGWVSSTYLILVSDHGHAGGEQHPNRRANLARDFFHRRLGWNVRVVGQEWRHAGSDPSRFVFLDHQAWAQAAVFLPKGAYHTGPWRPNTLEDLQAYDAGPNVGRVNLPAMLLAFRGPEWEPVLPAPVDLVLLKLDEDRVLVMRAPDNRAVIHVTRQDDGVERYRYEPASPEHDPLGYVTDPAVRDALGPGASPAAFLAAPHTADEWLRATAGTDYPDAVVGIAKLFRWQPPVADMAQARTPDLVVTAARGWSFRSDDELGTDHGSLLREAMRISLWLAGPNVRRGRMAQPRRIIDVLPTILDMAGIPYEPSELDGRAIRGIYE